MKRELKFRAWNGNKMLDDIVPVNKNTVITNIQGFPDSMMAVGDVVESIMQYTGLKDKNGKEIYEEDIVRFYHEKKLVEHFIEWDEFLCGFVFSDDNLEFNEDSECEVIGNIFENPYHFMSEKEIKEELEYTGEKIDEIMKALNENKT